MNMKTLATLALALLAQTAQAQFSSNVPSNVTATPSLVNRDLNLNLDLTLTACATVDVSITGAVQIDVADVIFSQATILLEADVCLCVVLGVFTSTAIDKLTAIVHSDASASRLAPYYAANKGSSPASVLAILLGNLLGQMPQDNCEYPANSTPNDDTCSATCSYSCNHGYMPCGEFCYDPNTQSCQSGYPVNNQRRSLSRRRNNANLRCASGQTICEVPNLTSNSAMNRLECIDTMANAESCGGCMYPSPGQVEGEDCTAIPNVAGVRCVTGKCIVESCARGFLLSDGDCIARKRLGGNVSHQAASNLLESTDELVFKPKAKRRVIPVTLDQKRRTV